MANKIEGNIESDVSWLSDNIPDKFWFLDNNTFSLYVFVQCERYTYILSIAYANIYI